MKVEEELFAGDTKIAEPDKGAIDFLSSQKDLTPQVITGIIISGLSLATWLFHMYSAYFGQVESFTHRSMHLMLFIILALLIKPLGRKSWQERFTFTWGVDLLLIILSIGVLAYLNLDIVGFANRGQTSQQTSFDLLADFLIVALVFELTRRTVGLSLVIISAGFMVHTIFARHFPSFLSGSDMEFFDLINFLVSDPGGIFGLPVQVISSFVVIYIFFGSLLFRTGAGKLFVEVGMALTGRQVGGPAKVSVVSSALFGTISGSAVANVMVDGVFTIPMMKRAGYPAHLAGGIEAATSTGGMIMPPVMGAGAFVMAVFLGVSYWDVCKAAAIPAILYFISLYFMVHFHAKRLGILPYKGKIPNIGRVMAKRGFLFIPLVLLVYLLYQGASPGLAAFWAIVVLMIVSLFRKDTRLTSIQFLSAIEDGVRASVVVAIACGIAGVIIACVVNSGIGLKLSNFIVSIAAQHLWLSLILTMVAGIILGLGLTPTVVYIMLSITIIPAIVQLGAPKMGAHLFAFYYGVLGDLTPPVCISAFAAAGIANAPPMATGFAAWRTGIAAFIVPLMWLYNPQLLGYGPVVEILWTFFTAVIGIICLASGVVGYLFTRTNAGERIVLLLCSLLLIYPGVITDGLGFAGAALVSFGQLIRKKRAKG